MTAPKAILIGQVQSGSLLPSGTKTYVQLLAEGLQSFGWQAEVWDLGIHPRDGTRHSGTGLRGRLRVPHLLSFWLRLFARLLGENAGPDVVYHVQRPEELLPIAILRPRARLVVSVHGPHWRSVEAKFGTLGARIYRVLQAIGLRRADRVIAVSRGVARSLLSDFPWVQVKLRVVTPMVDELLFTRLPQSEARARRGIPIDAEVVLYCGRFEPEKGFPLLLNSIEQLRLRENGVLLLLCGGGGEEDRLRTETTVRRIPCTYLGSVAHSDMPSVYACADAVVLTSAYEGFPTVVLEALSCGVPVVARQFEGLEDLAVAGAPICLLKSDRPEDFAAAISRMIAEGRDKIGQRIDLSAYSYRTVAGRVLAVYRETLGTEEAQRTGEADRRREVRNKP